MALDKVMLYAENDPTTKSDNVWLRGNPILGVAGTACPGGAASLTLTLTGVTLAQLNGVATGAPMRGYELVEMSLYTDASGEAWMGTRTQNKTTLAWASRQPVAGPLTAAGMQLAYFDTLGVVTAVPGSSRQCGHYRSRA